MLTQTGHSASNKVLSRVVQPIAFAAKGSLNGQITMMGATVPYARNAEVFGEGEPSEYVYKILSGGVRTYKVLSDGRRQIGAFYLPGDVFGLEVGGTHAFSAEAVVDSEIVIVKRSTLAALAGHNTGVAHELWNMTARELQRAQEHIMLLVKTAQERVAGFLLEMSTRLAGNNKFDLPMSRQDIADYLGLTIETVSRTLTQLENAATIALPTSRCIVLRNRKALNELNS